MTPTTGEQPTGGPRARYREQTRREIKVIALRQLAEGGIAGIALTRIAKELGLSGPALYRYFASRDDLLHALIRDGYDDVAAAVGAAATATGARPDRERLQALANALRGWALEAPHRYLLIAGSPLPGYAAPADTLERARAALGPFLAVFARGEAEAAIHPVRRQLADWARRDPGVAGWVAEWTSGDDTAAEGPDRVGTALAGAVLAWARMHGVVSLEVGGHFQGMGHDPATLFTAEVAALADSFHLG